jgi:hypothetical protein
MAYNYIESMKADIKDYIDNEINISDFQDMDELREHLNNELFVKDSVTGNASGSYTFNSYKAKEYVMDGMDDLLNAISDFCIDAKEVGEKFLNEEWEYFDVTIRCYLLGQAIDEVLEDMEENNELTFED